MRSWIDRRMEMCELVRRRASPRHRRIPSMSDKRESDFLAYILGAFVVALGGIAVGVASTNAVPEGDRRSGPAAVTAPMSAAAEPQASQAPATPAFMAASSKDAQK